MQRFAILDAGRLAQVDAQVEGLRVSLAPASVEAQLGWTLKPEGLCRGATCVPVRDRAALASLAGIDLAALARALGRPLALDVAERAAALGTGADERRAAQQGLEAPDFTLPDLAGRMHSLSEHRGRKVLLVAYASWCGCREDLPGWQALHEELGPHGLVPITVALDRSAEDPRPFIEKARPTHPSLIDTEHVLPELYHMVNVPTVIWVDEAGRVVRPHDAQFGTDTFTRFHGKASGPYLDLVRGWVREGKGALAPDEVRRHQPQPTAESQLARAERALAWHLQQRGRADAAERHWQRAAELAPGDWTIRRGSMPIRGQNPFGPEFFELAREGVPAYPMEALTPTRVAPGTL